MAYALPDISILPKHPIIIGSDMSTRGRGTSHTHTYPANGQPTSDITLASPADVDDAVQAARRAHPAWRALPGDRRRDLMFRLAALLEADAATLGQLGIIEKGEPAMLAPYIPAIAAQKFRYFGGWADKIQGLTVATWGGPAHDYVACEPYGVVGAIIPWNGPLFAAAMVLAPALAAGNCVVLKAPDLAPYAVMRLGELFGEAGFPPGVVNVLAGGADVGEAMVAHPGIDKIQFVGSGGTAKKVLRTAADTLKPCGLELGGKSAVIVFADAEIKDAARRGLSGAVSANGQGCVNGTRLLVERAIYEPYLQMLTAMAAHVRIGDPMDRQTVLGPVISEASAQRIQRAVQAAIAGGARLVAGGDRADGEMSDGFYLKLTILADVDNDSEIAQQEVFGPVLTVTPFDTEEDAVSLANATPYGLGGYIHTQNLRRAHQVAAALDAGMIQVNGAGEGMTPCVPFGGVKQSGYGRLGGEAGLREFLRIKNVWINLAKPSAP